MDETMVGYWDRQAATFDAEPDHGLTDPVTRAAWTECLRDWLPAEPCDVVDLGCGTGSLSLVAADLGHRVTAVDAAPGMVERARLKLAGTTARVVPGDAADPPLHAGRFDVVLVRHVLWALPDPGGVLRRWVELLRPAGRLVMIEGRWGTELAGIAAADLRAMIEPITDDTHVEELSSRPALWGREVSDERYAIVADRAVSGT